MKKNNGKGPDPRDPKKKGDKPLVPPLAERDPSMQELIDDPTLPLVNPASPPAPDPPVPNRAWTEM